MFVDASSLVAILRREEDWAALQERILTAGDIIHVSAMVRFEATLAVARDLSTSPNLAGVSKSALIAEAAALVSGYLKEIDARDVVIDGDIGAAAIDAAATYGKAVGHKAALNMGDCFSYACAKSLNLPLLYKGNDFAETDLA